MNSDSSSIDWLSSSIKPLDTMTMYAAVEHQKQLTKPAGSLGKLENVAIRLAAMQGVLFPTADHVSIAIFAADHGIAEEGVSVFPQSVTAEMVKNFSNGGAAICVAARFLNAPMTVYNLGTVSPTDGLANVVNCAIAPQTASFLHHPAMTAEQLAQAINTGRHAVLTSSEKQREQGHKLDLFIAGEMGIANTTAATAIAAVLLNTAPEKLAGPGTGLDAKGVSHKAAIIAQALQTHEKALANSSIDPIAALQLLGGFEIAALTGAYLTCAQEGVPAVVDGFICTVAALVACRINSEVSDWLIFSHYSAEPAYALLLEGFATQAPLLNLELRLGEGSGAAITVPLIRLACSLHHEMSTFEEAAVSSSTVTINEVAH
ncbi:nicotinate-nucleotide--dimethylbenzimidazole phosphoribosyltransferase [Neptunomonas japonica]|uniref:Nicotinate-nucleotide--dimethylbenzimidazole phosphoribosyltransferase n=1 Tax=Neptunomonas japonica JAMM 1380 TaxID=1441457 RepID=A0A7R6PSV2_9GAMM|nr:nicotinate-nucleotide--dimethylbenzimidazole phosphoribosyltransferase [Neptunomonas japonica]BBB29780.1 nicotinate-nucleotide--dimethylbenzimidazole phosphoribosyltransferase [Neptunomonas japonica JAMM 1380]